MLKVQQVLENLATMTRHDAGMSGHEQLTESYQASNGISKPVM
jgi:hypothetical protein